MKTKIHSNSAPPAVGPYSQAIEANGFVFAAGQIALKPDGTFVDGDIETQTNQVMTNLKAVLKEAGVEFKNVVRTEIFLSDMSDYAKMNEVYGSYMEEPYPARFTIGVKELPRGAKVEIAMIAAK